MSNSSHVAGGGPTSYTHLQGKSVNSPTFLHTYHVFLWMKQNREQTMRRGLIFNLQCSVPSTSINRYSSTTCRMKWQLRVRLVLERFSIILWLRVSSSHNVAKIKKTNRHFLSNTISENKSEINYLLSHKQEIINNSGHSEIISKPLIEIRAILVQGVPIHRTLRVQQVIKTTLQTF